MFLMRAGMLPFPITAEIYMGEDTNKKKSFATPIEYSFLFSALDERAWLAYDGSAREFERAEKVPECSVSLQAGLLQRSWVLERYCGTSFPGPKNAKVISVDLCSKVMRKERKLCFGVTTQ